MDAQALRMLADLGLARRDVISAPEDFGRRQRTDPREQDAVAAAFEALRKQTTSNNVGEGDGRATRLRAWNSKLRMMYTSEAILTSL